MVRAEVTQPGVWMMGLKVFLNTQPSAVRAFCSVSIKWMPAISIAGGGHSKGFKTMNELNLFYKELMK